MKVRDIIRLLESHGWKLRFSAIPRDPWWLPSRVHSKDDVPAGTLRYILRKAEVDQEDR